MKIIAIVNQKGGAGKTTSCVQLAQALVRRRRPQRVLVIDIDAQRDASDQLDHIPGDGEPAAPGTFEVLVEGRPLVEVVINTPSGVQLCPASPDLSQLDVLIGTQRSGPTRLRSALQAAPDAWDLVLLDCPPALGLATVNALVAADALLTPMMPESLVVKSIGPLSTSIGRAVVVNPRLRHIGYLLTRVDEREALAEQTREDLRQKRLPESGGGPPLWRTSIPVDAGLKCMPVRRGRGVLAYETAAKELLERLRRLDHERSPS